MAFLENLIGGAAGAGADILADERKAELATTQAKTLADYNNALSIKRDKVIQALAVNTANQQREAQVSRVDTAAGKIADTGVAAKRGLINTGIANPSTWTPEQQSAVDQSLALDKQDLIVDPEIRERAAMATGDISSKDAAEINREKRRLAVTEARDKRAQEAAIMRDATARYVADLKDETANKRIEALVGKMGGGKSGKNEALSFIDGARKDIKDEASQIRSLYQSEIKDLPQSKRAAVEEKYKPQFEAVEKKRRQLDNDFNALRKDVGLPPIKDEATPAPKPAAAPPMPMPREKAGLKPGAIYQTSRGPAKWNGSAFEAQ